MQKELNKKLKIDEIDFSEVLNGLDSIEGFTSHDIKRALRKTGRSFNTNSVFYKVVGIFIDKLGDTCTTKFEKGLKRYTIQDKNKALEKLGVILCPKTPAKKVIKVEEPKAEEKKEAVNVAEEIKKLFKRKYTALEMTTALVVIFGKYGTKELDSKVLLTEMENLGYNWSTFVTTNKSITEKIFETLGYKLELFRVGKEARYAIRTSKEILDVYLELKDLYKTITGSEPRDLDDIILTSSAKKEETVKEEVKDRREELREIKEKMKIRETKQEDLSVKWEKALILSALKARKGASTKISSVCNWIKNYRFYQISEERVEELSIQLNQDSDSFKLASGYIISYHGKDEFLERSYNPKDMVETIFVKTKLTPEEMKLNFSDLEVNTDGETNSGEFIYEIAINRSYKCELTLKKLLKFLEIQGKIYSPESWIIKRIQRILKEEENSAKAIKMEILDSEK